MPFTAAVMVADPVLRDVTKPVDLTVATEIFDELQIGEGIACEVPSE